MLTAERQIPRLIIHFHLLCSPLRKRKTASSSNQKTDFRARSNSFPSTQNPIISLLDDHLCRLRASEDAPTSASFGGKLCSLQDLHDCVNKVLDLCDSAKDALLQTKECIHALQSILRRTGCGEIGLTSEVKKYLTSRKVVKRTIHKTLKVMQSKCTDSSSNGDHETTTVSNMLKEVQATSLNVTESLLSFISRPKTKSTGRSLASKMVHPKKVASAKEETDINEFAKMDAALLTLVDRNTCKSVNIKGVLSQLENLDLCIQDLDESLECLFRQLIKTRVSLLNILNH